MDDSKTFEMSDVNLLQVFTDAVIIQKPLAVIFRESRENRPNNFFLYKAYKEIVVH